ncbi:MAG: DEAD/DEAH box helicase [Solirubrobacteraceae bacterium]
MTSPERRPALTLRPYQQEAITAVERALERGVRRPLVVLPTGTGKTACFSALIARRGGSALVLAHRDELLRQAAQKIAIADPTLALGVGFVAAHRDDVAAPVLVASVQTLAQTRRLQRLPRQFDTVIVDEAHHASARSYRRILAHLDRSPLILGVTATPARADGTPLGVVWEEIVYQRGIAEMIRAGYLADVRGLRVGLEAVDLDDVAQSGGDYQADALGEALEQASAPRHVLAAYQRHATGRKTIVFVPTVALAYRMAGVFRDAGIAAEGLDGTTAPERRRGVLDRLRTGEVTVVVNAALLTEGFDEPSVSCIIVATPTRSQVKYTQLVGRGLRPFPGKDDCLVIDVVGVTDRLDLQTLPRLFGLRQPTAVGETVTEAIDRQTRHDQTSEQPPAAAAARRKPEGAMRSRDVQLLGSRRRERKLHWLRHRDYWLVSLGQAGLLALAPAGGRWTVLRLDRDHIQPLAVDVDLGYAHGIAEDYVRQTGALRLADTSARWRRAPMNDAQASLLRRLGITAPDAASKGQASDLITLARGAALLDRLTRHAA